MAGHFFCRTVKLLSRQPNMLPVVFVSHAGGPCWYMDKATDTTGFMADIDKDSKSADFMRNLRTNARLPRNPKAILVVSAHWEERDHTVGTSPKPSLYFDYYGFPEYTYKLQWPVPGEPVIAKRVCQLLQSHGITCREDAKRGLDHGVFVPLKLAYPEADVPGKWKFNSHYLSAFEPYMFNPGLA
jgi:aromatic ring-opening dioxygenase catalytic subunit (LigB family)